MADYFGGLGELVAFWQIDYTVRGRQIIAWGKESFTLAGCGLEGGCELALVFELSDGAITRLLVVEDLTGHTLRDSLPETAGPGVAVSGLGQSWVVPKKQSPARV